ncbi:MAG TPA: DUF58 domain-containing protein [Gammaproteobacteria bacterium]
MRTAAREKVFAWADKRQGRDPDPAVLARRRIYILPTRQGMVFGLLLFAMLLGSMNYSSSLGFTITFMLAALGFVAMHHTHRNLENLELRAGFAAPVFAGDDAHFPLLARNTAAVMRGGIALDDGEHTQGIADLQPGDVATLTLRLPTTRRGWLRPRRFGIHTTYPFGLFRAWAWLRMDLACLVYPAPAAPGSLPPSAATDTGNSEMLAAAGQEDFSGLRKYLPGDAPRHVAWRASARTDGELLVKEFRGGGVASRWFDWTMTASEDNTEERIARLTRWVMDAQAHGERWGLRLPGLEIPLAAGEAHYQRSLRALALFELPGEHAA